MIVCGRFPEKRVYRTKAFAKKVKSRMRGCPGRDQIEAYHCCFCGHWHLGHKR